MSLKFKKELSSALAEVQDILSDLKKMDDHEFDRASSLRTRVRKIVNNLLVYEHQHPETGDILSPVGLEIFRSRKVSHWVKQLKEVEFQLEYWKDHWKTR